VRLDGVDAGVDNHVGLCKTTEASITNTADARQVYMYTTLICSLCSQFSSVMSCIVCQALPRGTACSQCTEAAAKETIKQLYNSGRSVEVPSAGLLEKLSASPECVVLQGRTVVHIYTHELLQAAKTHDEVSVEGWRVTKREFARKHASKFGMWYLPQKKKLMRTTALCLYDKDSLFLHMVRADSAGVNISDIVKEYDNAYLDVYELVSEGKLCEYRDKVWLNPDLKESTLLSRRKSLANS